MKKYPLTLAVVSAIATMPLPLVTYAQSEGLMLEEVVVSARKRSEDLQDVGLSVC